MLIGVPTETADGERRVALVPESVGRLTKAGVPVCVQAGAGSSAAFLDDAYSASGASLAAGAPELFAKSDVVVKVQRPSDAELNLLREGTAVVGFLAPLGDPGYVQKLAQCKLTALSMETIPRITRAQSMDALSSQANVAGYKGVLIAAETLPRFFPMLTTAAGTIPPARVLILGAGVAGLQAIATARRLGAVVSGYDTRAVVKEQVQSLGATFLDLDVGGDAEGAGGYAKELTPEQIERQRALMVQHIGASDCVITTAAVPGRRAPILITAEAVRAMKPGSVIVDLAAETGGNVDGTKPGEVVTSANGVTIVGLLNLPSTLPYDASRLYARNVQALLDYITKDGALALDPSDEIVAGTTITRDGEIVHEPTRAALTGGAA